MGLMLGNKVNTFYLLTNISTKFLKSSHINNTVDFKANNITRNKNNHFIMINWLTYQKDVTILNVYVSNNKASKYDKQTTIELQRETDKFTIILRDFNTPFSILNRSSRKKNNRPSREKCIKDIEHFNNPVNHFTKLT